VAGYLRHPAGAQDVDGWRLGPVPVALRDRPGRYGLLLFSPRLTSDSSRRSFWL
jgi:hypothetical protein